MQRRRRLTIALSEEERKRLKFLAGFLDVEMGPLIRTWIEEKLKEYEKSSEVQAMQKSDREPSKK